MFSNFFRPSMPNFEPLPDECSTLLFGDMASRHPQFAIMVAGAAKLSIAAAAYLLDGFVVGMLNAYIDQKKIPVGQSPNIHRMFILLGGLKSMMLKLSFASLDAAFMAITVEQFIRRCSEGTGINPLHSGATFGFLALVASDQLGFTEMSLSATQAVGALSAVYLFSKVLGSLKANGAVMGECATRALLGKDDATEPRLVRERRTHVV